MKTIGIFPNIENDRDLLGTMRVINILSGRAELLVCDSLYEKLMPSLGNTAAVGVRAVSENELFSQPEILIVLGGDGTILRAARRCKSNDICILGINLGHIGYMTELELNELAGLEKLFTEDYSVENRMLIEVVVDDERLFALNEAVIGGASIFRMVELELYCDGNLVNKYRADGLIASTPTGSTAYSMSAGGAVVDPRMEAVIVTPICSHSLNATPLIFSAGSRLCIKNVTLREDELYLSVDGGEMRRLPYGREVIIERSDETIKFIRLKDGGFYEVLNKKMADK